MTYQEIYQNLIPLLTEHKLTEAIKWSETELKKTQTNGYHKILNKDLSPLIPSLTKWIDAFYKRVSNNISVKAIYCEMNGFSINPDKWFIDLFAFDNYQGLEDLDWVADWEERNVTLGNCFTITGMEELQQKYKAGSDKTEEQASMFCDFLVILRLQELFMNTVNKARKENIVWANIPMIITAHDWELIYQTT